MLAAASRPAFADSAAVGALAAEPLPWIAAASIAVAAALAIRQVLFARRCAAVAEERDRLRSELAELRIDHADETVAMLSLIAPAKADDRPLLSRAGRPLAVMLDAGEEDLRDLDTIARRLDADGAVRFRAAVAALIDERRAFAIEGRRRDGQRWLRIAGTPVEPLPGTLAAAAITFVDVTGYRERIARAEAGASDARRQAEDLRTALNLVAVPFWCRDEDLKVHCANLAADVVDLDAEAAKDISRRTRRVGANYSESRYVVVQGERRLFEVTEAPAADGKGTVGWAVDVTALEEAQAEIARHIAAHEDVLEGMSTAIAIFGPDKRLKFSNSAFARLWDVDRRQLDGEPTVTEFLELLRERRRLPEQSDFRVFRDNWNRMFTHLIEAKEELLFLPDDTTLRMAVMPHPFGGLLLTFEDVTDRLALERMYNTLNEVQRETIDNLAEGIVVFGADGKLRLCNPTFCRLWNLPDSIAGAEPHVSEVLDRMRPLFPAEVDWSEVRAGFLGRIADRASEGGRIERTDDSVIDYAFVPLPDGGVLIHFRDVSDTLNVQRALQDRNEALENADRVKSEFIANVSYELRTPLNAIIGFAEMMQKGYVGEVNEKQSDYLRAILDSSGRLSALIGNIIDLASIEAGYMLLEPEELSVPDVVSSVFALVEERARGQSIGIAFDIAPDATEIEADGKRLKQILFNLMASGFQFTPAGGHIRLAVWSEGPDVVFQVADDGSGIPDDMRNLIFEAFSNSERRMRAAGLGLSLPLVRRLVDLHHGTMTLESEIGVGTTVTCRLPRRQSEAARAEAAAV